MRTLITIREPGSDPLPLVIEGDRFSDPNDGPIDINSASAAQLEKLPGIGPETAKAIIAGRPYQTPKDLETVKGIGPKTLEKLRPGIRFPSDVEPEPLVPGT